MKVVPFKGRVGRWAIQELRLWEGLYREPTPAGSVRHIKNWSYEGRFLEARELHQPKDVNINTTAPRPRTATASPASTASTTPTTPIAPIAPFDEPVPHPTPLAANRATANQRRAFRGALRRAATEPATFPRNESGQGPLATNLQVCRTRHLPNPNRIDRDDRHLIGCLSPGFWTDCSDTCRQRETGKVLLLPPRNAPRNAPVGCSPSNPT